MTISSLSRMDIKSIRKVHALSEAVELQPTITIENIQLTDAEIVGLFKNALPSTSADLDR